MKLNIHEVVFDLDRILIQSEDFKIKKAKNNIENNIEEIKNLKNSLFEGIKIRNN